jgi:gamma-glutamylcyclotransferase (GGCT)/AIG2-like uncharacterized protein YtfP
MNLFVYGTLQRGQAAHCRLSGARFAGNAVLKGFALYNLGWYPGIVEDDMDSVSGEAYADIGELLPELDRYEGEGSTYSRLMVKVTLETGEEMDSFIYVYNYPVEPQNKVPFAQQPWKGVRK